MYQTYNAMYHLLVLKYLYAEQYTIVGYQDKYPPDKYPPDKYCPDKYPPDK